MEMIRSKSLRFKINAAILTTCAIIVVFFGTLFYPFELNRRKARFEEIQVLLATVYQQKRDELANEIFAGQRLALTRTLEEMQRIKGIDVISVYDLKGTLLTTTNKVISGSLRPAFREELDQNPVFTRTIAGSRSYAEYATAVQVIGEKTGYLRMHYDLADMERESVITLFFFIGLMVSTLLVMSVLLNLLLSRAVIRPASILRDAIRKVRWGHLGERVDLHTGDEIGDMASDFNDMSLRLKEQHIALTEAIQEKDAYAIRLEDSNRELEALNTQLEDRVEERTVELVRSNRQLQEEINERRQTEKEKRDLEERLARSQKMEALGLLAGGVAHDLNNILSGVVSYPELLLMDMAPDNPMRQPIETIKRSGEKAAAIVQDLLTLARRGVTNTEVTNMNDLVREYLCSPEHQKLVNYHGNVTIDEDLEDDLLNIEGSPVHLRKTLMNLISNAAEAQPQGGRAIVYTMNRYVDRPVRGYDKVREGEYVVLGVKDHGGGIATEDLRRIFEPFYTKKVMGRSGTGLGMAVVWGTVQDHNGYIDVISEEGKGTTFELYFPITRQSLSVKRDVIPVDDYLGQGQTVLVVDDVEDQREIAANMLRVLNYSVTCVSSGEEALGYLRGNRADLLVLDMIMDPGMDGLDTYREVQKIRPGQKALIASGFAESDRVKEAQRLGAGEYVKKPYTLEGIGLAIKRALSGAGEGGSPYRPHDGERPPEGGT